MRRKFPYITLGVIQEKLKKEGITITRQTLWNLEKKGYFKSTRSPGGWRVFTPAEAEAVIQIVKEVYRFIEPEK